MCWKSHVQAPGPTAMPIGASTTEDLQNNATITQGDTGCPELATACSNVTSSTIECHNGFCCEHNGEPLCSCLPGWSEPYCDVEIFHTFESSILESSTHQWLIGVLIGALLVGIVIIVIVLYRKWKKRNSEGNSTDMPEHMKLSPHQNT